jgi:putative DNA primase/helicase
LNANLAMLDEAIDARGGSDALVKRLPVAVNREPDGVVLTRGDTIHPEPISWLWPGWLARGKLHILAGAPGQGKTTIALALAARLTVGGRWPEGTRCSAASVVIWSGEDDPRDTLVPRLRAMGADMARVHFVTAARVDGEQQPFDPARDMLQLAAEVERIGDVGLLLVDPVVSAVAGDSHKNTEVRRALQPLVDLAAGIGTAVLGITHFSKGSAGRDPTDRVVGSMAFGAVARVVMVAAKVKGQQDDEDRRVLARSKSNIGPDDGGFEYHLTQRELQDYPGVIASCVEFGASIAGTARELLAEAEAEPDGSETAAASDDAADFLRDMLAGSIEVTSREVTNRMKSEGFSDKVIRRAREKLGVTVRREGFGKQMQSLWSLPAAPIAAHSCPLAPAQESGQEWAAMQFGSRNDAKADMQVGCPADDTETF